MKPPGIVKGMGKGSLSETVVTSKLSWWPAINSMDWITRFACAVVAQANLPRHRLPTMVVPKPMMPPGGGVEVRSETRGKFRPVGVSFRTRDPDTEEDIAGIVHRDTP